MKEINGRHIGSSPIEDMLGKKVFKSTYSTNSFDEYSASLKSMNITDLHNHSMNVLGEIVRGDRSRIIMKLEAAFKKSNQQSLADYQKLNQQILSQEKRKYVENLLKRSL